MTIKQAIKTVESHNKWRRGGNGKMSDPKLLGEALDALLIVAKDYLTIYDMDKVNIKPNQKSI